MTFSNQTISQIIYPSSPLLGADMLSAARVPLLPLPDERTFTTGYLG